VIERGLVGEIDIGDPRQISLLILSHHPSQLELPQR
jgi:hypothetical protein